MNTKRVLASFVIAAMCIVPAFASATTAEELQAQVAQLAAVLQKLRAQQSAAAIPATCFVPTYDMSLGSTDVKTGGQVTQLQLWLKSGGFLDTEASGYFGAKTASALSKWQKANGLQGLGQLGPKSRAIMAMLCSASAQKQQPKIGVAFTVSPSYISLGEPAILSWDASAMFAKSCVLSGGAYKNSPVPVAGSLSVTPDRGSAYLLSCYDGNEKVQVVPGVVDVKDWNTNAYIVQPSLTLVANPPAITVFTPVKTVNISWVSHKTVACYINGGTYANQRVTASALGTVFASPTQTTTYTVYCTGDNGEYLSDSVTIRVE